jgi:glycosyltransferase involved in cell wall biosynthesis
MQKHKIGVHRTYSIINNVVDEEIFYPAPERLPASAPIRFVNVSCFENRSKNLTGLVDLVAQLAKKGRRFECVMAGTGLDFNSIVEYIKAKGVANYISLPGMLNDKQVAELMRSCHFENVPVVISEALMCALPVVATRVGSVAELVDASNGYLVPADDADELLASVELMMENYSSFDRKQIHANAQSRFSGDAVLGQFNELYSGIIK